MFSPSIVNLAKFKPPCLQSYTNLQSEAALKVQAGLVPGPLSSQSCLQATAGLNEHAPGPPVSPVAGAFPQGATGTNVQLSAPAVVPAVSFSQGTSATYPQALS